MGRRETVEGGVPPIYRFRDEVHSDRVAGAGAFPRVVREAEGGALITVTRHDEPVAYVVGRGRMEAILETLEILADPGAMKAARAYRAGRMKFGKVSDLR